MFKSYINNLRSASIITKVAGASFGLAVFVLAYLIHRYAVNVPTLDDWSMVHIFVDAHNHTLSFHDFWAQHNEHRVVVPEFVILGLAAISNWNQVFIEWVSFVIACAMAGFLASRVVGTLRADRTAATVASVLTPWILLSPVQWENWLWAWEISWFLMLAAAIAAIWLLVTRPWGQRGWISLVVAALAATVATYSIGNGMIIWAVGLGILLIQQRTWLVRGLWTLAALVATGAYMIGYHSPPNSYPKTLIVHKPIEFLHHFVVIIGRPLGWDTSTAGIAGVALLLIFAVATIYIVTQGRALVMRSLPWLALAVFAGLTSASISFSRFGAGYEQAMSSRYYVISSLFLVAVLVLGFIAYVQYRKQTKQVAGALATLTIGLIVGTFVLYNYFYGDILMGVQKGLLFEVRNCVQHVASPKDVCLKKTYPPDTAYVYRQIQDLKRIGWGGL